MLESKSSLSKALIAQNMPMNKDTIKDYVKNVVCQEQNNLVKILDGKKPIHDVLNVDTIDSFPKQMESALSEAGSFIADTLLARLLVDATVTAMDLIQR